MGDSIEVDFEGIQLAIDGLRAEASELDLAVDTFDSESEYLLLSWSGEAAEAFQASQESWAEDGRVRREELRRMIVALESILEIYVSTEKSIRTMCGAE